MRKYLANLIPLLGSGLLTFLIYGNSLSFPFTFDDFEDLPRATSHAFFQPWPYHSYYRPLSSSVLKLIYLALGGYEPFWYHLLPVALHAINGWLVYLLARRLAGPWAAPWAAVFFLLYPFSYQVVPWVSAVSYPLATLFILGSLLTYYEARESGSRGGLVVSLALMLLAATAHEYGVMAAPMVLALEGFLYLSGRRGRFSLWPLASMGLAAAYLALWWLVPKASEPWAWSLYSLAMNGLFFLQGLVYPVAGLVEGLSQAWGWSPVTALWITAFLCLGALGFIFWRGRRLTFFALSLIWFGAAVAPAWALLSFAYVIDGARLLYVASVPAALLWAGLWRMVSNPRGLAWRWPLLLVLTLAIAWQSWSFLSVRMDMYAYGASVVRQVAQAGKRAGAEGSLLYVNVPSWFAPKQPDLPLGHTGVTFLPEYIGLSRVIYLHEGFEPRAVSLSYTATLAPWRYNYAPHGRPVGADQLATAIRESSLVFATALTPRGVFLREAGSVQRQAVSTDGGYRADFGGLFLLQEVRLSRQAGRLSLELEWLARRGAREDLTVFLHLYDAGGRLVAQEDGYPLMGLFPMSRWKAGDLVRDRRELAYPPALENGAYTLKVGVYDRRSGARLTARDAQGKPYPDNAVSLAQLSLPDRQG
jgi:phage shock protein PspC (stress-responsive transcriptional regulator)